MARVSEGPSSTHNIGETGVALTSTRVQALVVPALVWKPPGAPPRSLPSRASDRCRLLRHHLPCNLGGGHRDCLRSRSTGLPLAIPPRPARIRNLSPLERQSPALLLHPATKLHANRWASLVNMSKRFPGASPRAMLRPSSNKGRRLLLRVQARLLPKRIKKGEGLQRLHERFQEKLVPFSSENGNCP